MTHKRHRVAADLGLLTLRLTVGGLMAGHGAQKLFGSFGGSGLEGTAGWLESLGLKPGRPWAVLAGGSELASGLLTAAGLLHPVGPLSIFGPMTMAWTKVHADKPIWVTSGGAELPLVNMAAATALALAGPGRLSLDNALGLRTSRLVAAASVIGVAAGIAAGVLSQPEEAEHDAREEALDGPAGGEPPLDPTPAVGLDAPRGATLEDLAGAGVSDEEFDYADAGTVAYGGIAQDLPDELPELAKEVGADPPGPFPGWGATERANPRPAGDTRGDEPETRPRD